MWATARDGARVPMSVVYKKSEEGGAPQDAPLVLYAYGSYGHSLDPYFSAIRLSLLDRGFVYVIAHIRGGEDLGRDWYDQGKLLHKKNTFHDFIDCGEYLDRIRTYISQKTVRHGWKRGGIINGCSNQYAT